MIALDPRPSRFAANLSLAFAVLAAAGLFLFPYATYTRNFNAAGLLQRFPAGLLEISGFRPERMPEVAASLAFGWVALFALVLAAALAVKRSRWLWASGLLVLLAGVLAVVMFERSLGQEIQRLLAEGVRPRRVPFNNGGPNLGLFSVMFSGLVIALAGVSAYPRGYALLNRARALLVPLVAIALAIVVGALLVMFIQPVPFGGEPSAAGYWYGKIDLVWFVYSSLFAPLSNLGDAFQSLTLATPLIFTGLAVAFAFRAGLFNIGAPGQLAMGAIFAMLVGVYLPAPAPLLLPLSVIAAALGGAFWGFIPGFLKAHYGSSEVINTIMLNYIASAIFIFLIGTTSFPFFVGQTISWSPLVGLAVGIAVWVALRGRQAYARWLALASGLLAAVLLWPALTFPGGEYGLPFKAEGFEAKSEELQAGARLVSVPQLLGFEGAQTAFVSLAPLLALVVFFALNYFLARQPRRTWIALVGALVVLLLGWTLVGVRVDVTPGVAASRLNASFFIALFAALFFAVFMWRTAAGYALRAVGLAPKAAQYGGISVPRNTVLAMTLAGALAGLGATHYVLGGALDEYRLKQNLPYLAVGFDGITVALMGQSTPAGVVAASVLFGTLDTGGLYVSQQLEKVNKDIVTVLKALIVLFIAAGGFLSRRITDPPPPMLLPNLAESSQENRESQGLKPTNTASTHGAGATEEEAANPLNDGRRD